MRQLLCPGIAARVLGFALTGCAPLSIKSPEIPLSLRKQEVTLLSRDCAADLASFLNHLIQTASPELASVVSRNLLTDIRSSQARSIIPNHLAQAGPLIQRFEKWARGHGDISRRASRCRMRPSHWRPVHTLQRRCEAVLGKSPSSYFQDLRIERAQSLLQGSGLDVEAIAAEVGYGEAATLRALLRQRLGQGVRELRASFRHGSRQAPHRRRRIGA